MRPPEQVYIRLNGLVIKLKSLKSGISWLENHEVIKNFLLVIMLTHEDMTFQIHRSPNFATLTPDDVFSIFKTHREYKETAQEMRMHCQLTEVAQARVQKPSLALKAREKVVVESSEEEDDDEDEATKFYKEGMEEIALLIKTFHKRFKPRLKGKFTKRYSKSEPERFFYVCESNDHFIHECSDPKKRGDKDKSKDKKRKIYFKSDKKEKAFLGMPDCSAPPPMKTKKKNTMELSVWLLLLQAHLKQALLQQRLHHQI
jgi:hypothetical protein